MLSAKGPSGSLRKALSGIFPSWELALGSPDIRDSILKVCLKCFFTLRGHSRGVHGQQVCYPMAFYDLSRRAISRSPTIS